MGFLGQNKFVLFFVSLYFIVLLYTYNSKAKNIQKTHVSFCTGKIKYSTLIDSIVDVDLRMNCSVVYLLRAFSSANCSILPTDLSLFRELRGICVPHCKSVYVCEATPSQEKNKVLSRTPRCMVKFVVRTSSF